MRRFIVGWKQRGLESRLRAKIVSYADDYVICCQGSADEALVEMRRMMAKLKLTINEAKTQVCQLPQERFDFLGYNFRRRYSTKTGRAYLGTRPSKKSLSKIIGGNSRVHRPGDDVSGGRRIGVADQPQIGGLVQLFLVRTRE